MRAPYNAANVVVGLVCEAFYLLRAEVSGEQRWSLICIGPDSTRSLLSTMIIVRAEGISSIVCV